MKLNNKQSLAIIKLLVDNKMLSADTALRYAADFGDLFDDGCREIRVISCYGAAGKLWNVDNRIYVTGKSLAECIDSDKYQNQIFEIDEINKNIAQLIELYNDKDYIFTMDCSWAGCIIVIAKNEKDARKIMETNENYDYKREVDKHEIVNGFEYANYGDM